MKIFYVNVFLLNNNSEGSFFYRVLFGRRREWMFPSWIGDSEGASIRSMPETCASPHAICLYRYIILNKFVNKKLRPIHPSPNQRFGRWLLGKTVKFNSSARSPLPECNEGWGWIANYYFYLLIPILWILTKSIPPFRSGFPSKMLSNLRNVVDCFYPHRNCLQSHERA